MDAEPERIAERGHLPEHVPALGVPLAQLEVCGAEDVRGGGARREQYGDEHRDAEALHQRASASSPDAGAGGGASIRTR